MTTFTSSAHVPVRCARSGFAWSEIEDRALCRQFAAGVTLEELAQELERSAFAIEARLRAMNIIRNQPGGSEMTAHQNRSKKNRRLDQNPTPAEVRAAREAAGLTQAAAGELIYSTLRAWQGYEAEASANDARRMHPQLFEAFLLKTGQAPAELVAAIADARRRAKRVA